MDVHISNVPPQCREKALKNFLRGKLRSFGVTVFECKKPNNKRFGFLTIPDIQQAECFLSAFAITGSLSFNGNALIVKRGYRSPDQKLVEGLRNRQKDAALHEAQPRSPRSKSKFNFTSYSCGTICFHKGELSFLQSVENVEDGAIFFGKRALTISSPDYNPRSVKHTIKLEIPYDSIEQSFTEERSERQREGFFITLRLHYPPKVTQLLAKPQDIIEEMNQLMLRERAKHQRIRGFSPGHETAIATCLSYRIAISPTCISQIRGFILKSEDFSSSVRLPLKVLQYSQSYDPMASFKGILARTEHLDFATKFQIQRLAQNCFLTPLQATSLIDPVLSLARRISLSSAASAVRRMARRIPFPGPDTDPLDFEVKALNELLNDCAGTSDQHDVLHTLARKHRHLFLVHQAIVTPAGVYLEGPELEPANRVLRKYDTYAQTNFLRVKFMDEDGSEIRYDRVNSLEKIHHVWFKEQVLQGGIDVAGQNFTFLGFSNSSLKDQSCWFMSEFWQNDDLLCSWDVVKKLGDFRDIRSPAKCAARIGQAFSDTQGGAVDTTNTVIEDIPDVKVGDRVFSDGCGTVSKQLIKRIWKTYRRNCRPTCFQIRRAGAKGMISLDSRLKGEVLRIRPSMKKFESEDKHIEICDAARRALPFFLNRQIVKILEDLGVEENACLALQARAISLLRESVSSPGDVASFLEQYNVGRGWNMSWFIENLDTLGISCFDDIFLRSCIENAVMMQLRLIKHKARILVENAYTLFGIMDETATLLQDQICCRANGETVVGRAAITRSPALHPGDIQIVKAVDIDPGSPLMDLDNCVIFSQKGERDLPSQLSGGDLDGDLYNVIFDPRLIPSTTCIAADYPRANPIDLYRIVEKEDITRWFIQFMENDQLARIAITHQHISDYKRSGTRDLEAIQLAQMHSDAVDFQKSGIPVDMTRMPKTISARPDFMAPDPRLLLDRDGQPIQFQGEEFTPSDDEDENNPDVDIDPDVAGRPRLYYKSTKVLGKLYRAVDEQSFLEKFEAAHRTHNRSGVTQRLFTYIERETHGLQWRHLLDWAWGVRSEYEELVIGQMQTYSQDPRRPLLELEVFTGEIIGKRGSLPSRQVREQARGMKEQFNDGLTYIVQRIIHGNDAAMDVDEDNPDFDIDPNWADTSSLRDEALERSIACLHVSMQEGEKLEDNRGKSLESFQYVAGMVALRECKIFKRRNATEFMGVEILNFS